MPRQGIRRGDMLLKFNTILIVACALLLLFAFCSSTGMADDTPIPKTVTASGAATLLHPKRPASLLTLPLIAGIDNPQLNDYQTQDFLLTTDRVLHLYALGRGRDDRMLDWGGVEDRATGQMIWIMRFLSTRYGGGHQLIRTVDRILPLPAGSYRLHFKTGPVPLPSQDGQSLKPGLFHKGIWLYDDTQQHTAHLNRFWDKAVSPEAHGWSGAKLSAMIPELEKIGTDALMVVTDGKVVFQYGSTANIIRSHSVRKSLLSGLYGSYAANGKIDLEATLGRLGIQEISPLTEQEKQATVLDLLKARSGVYIRAAAESTTMRKGRPQRGAHQPGTFWYYNNWDFNVLGTVFRQETGQDIYQAFKKDIADPIGMQDFILDRQAYQYEKRYSLHPAYPFLISARDLARFGQLFLQQGRWGSRQIIPIDWIRAGTRSYSITNRPGIGYGYMWWTVTADLHGIRKGSFFADGFGGQRLWVIPHINTVIVHRIDIRVPGTNAVFAGLAPDAVTRRIMSAYIGDKTKGSSFHAEQQKAHMGTPSFFDHYGRSPDYYGRSFSHFRIFFRICGAIFISTLVFWIVYRAAKFIFTSRRSENTVRHSGLYPLLLRWTSAIGGLVCALYIHIILTIPNAFEYVAMVGMPAGMNRLQTVIIHLPKFSVLFALFLLTGTFFSWTRHYWSIIERVHFTLVALTAAAFAILAFRLNLIILV